MAADRPGQSVTSVDFLQNLERRPFLRRQSVDRAIICLLMLHFQWMELLLLAHV